MNKIVPKFFLILLLVVYIYSIVFDAIPISTKIILEAFGFLFSLRYFIDRKYVIRKEIRQLLVLVIVIIFWDIVTTALNSGNQYHLTKDVVVPAIGSVFGAQLIYDFSQKYRISLNSLLYLLTTTIFLESVLSLMMKAYPPIYGFVDSILVFDFGRDTITSIFDITRIYGIGNAIYFGVLPSCTLGVMSSIYLVNHTSEPSKKIVLLVMWAVISLTSFFIARWSALIVGLSLLYLLLSLKNQRLINKVGIVLGLSIVFGGVLLFAIKNLDSDLQDWAFSIFLTGEDDGSAEHVKDWWTTTNFDIKTFLVGDARFTDPNDGYYKHVDVGYFREIFYGGIIGLYLILYAHYRTLKSSYLKQKNNSYKYYLFFLFLGYMAILAKGDANMLSFFILVQLISIGGIAHKKVTV